MTNTNKMSRSMVRVTLMVLALLAATLNPLALVAQTPPESEIRITEVPPSTSGGPNEIYPIAGTVTGVASKDYKDYRVVIYVYAGAQWWVQPFDYAPTTEIKASGKFETETHGGTIYAALLVRSAYRAKATLPALPDVGGDVLARHRVSGKKE